MRLLLICIVLVAFNFQLDAQRGRGPLLDGVWLETSIGRNGKLLPINAQPKRTTLILEPDGYFEEIRPGRRRYDPDRRFVGRWDADYRYGGLVLRVDQPGRAGATPRSYRRGRTQRINYSIVYSNAYELVLRDRRTGRKRVFLRE